MAFVLLFSCVAAAISHDCWSCHDASKISSNTHGLSAKMLRCVWNFGLVTAAKLTHCEMAMKHPAKRLVSVTTAPVLTS